MKAEWCVVLTDKDGVTSVAGPLRSAHYAGQKAQQLLATGDVASATVVEISPWCDIRDAHGIVPSVKAQMNAVYRAERIRFGRHIRTVSAVGVNRRLEGLMALGWSLPRLEKEGGFGEWGLREIHHSVYVHRDTHRRVADLYDRLSSTPPTAETTGERIGVARALSTAKKKGYPVPACWDDDEIDDPSAAPYGRLKAAS